VGYGHSAITSAMLPRGWPVVVGRREPLWRTPAAVRRNAACGPTTDRAVSASIHRVQLVPSSALARRALPAAAAQWLRFAAVGVANTLLSLCVYAVLVRVGLHYLLASSVAFALGVVNSYALNRRWTFRSRDRRAPEAVRFGVVQCVGLGVDVGLLYALVDRVGVQHLVAQALVFPAASAVTFLLSRHWAFAGARVDR
jgi:putative flippase GtrA